MRSRLGGWKGQSLSGMPSLHKTTRVLLAQRPRFKNTTLKIFILSYTTERKIGVSGEKKNRKRRSDEERSMVRLLDAEVILDNELAKMRAPKLSGKRSNCSNAPND